MEDPYLENPNVERAVFGKPENQSAFYE